MKCRPEEAVVEPCDRTTSCYLARQQISPPPEFLAGDIPEYENRRVVNGHPPRMPQWNALECVGGSQMR
jgi:hypothetical protein